MVMTKFVMPDGSDLPAGSGIPPITSSARQILPLQYSLRAQSVLRATVRDTVNTIDFPLSLPR